MNTRCRNGIAVIAVNYLLFTWCSKCPLTQQIHTACIWWYWILLLLKAFLLSHSQRDNIANNAMYLWITLYTEFAFHLEANVHGGEWSMKKKNRYTSPTTAETIAKEHLFIKNEILHHDSRSVDGCCWCCCRLASFIYLYFSFIFSGYMVQILWVCRTHSREWAWIKKSLLKYLWLRFFFVRMMSTWFLFNALWSLFNGDVESKKSEFIIWIIHTMKCKYEYESGDRDWMKRKR